MIKLLKYIGILLTGTAGLLILAVAVINLLPGNIYKDLLSSSIQSATGRELTIDGDIDVSLFSTFGFKASGINFANADWGSREKMVSGGDIEAEIALYPLLQGILDVTLLVDAPDLLLETRGSGLVNWQFIELAEQVTEAVKSVEEIEKSLEKSASAGGFPLRLRIRQVFIQGSITYINGTSGSQTSAGNIQLIIKPDGDRLTVDLTGKLNDIPLEITGAFTGSDFLVNNQLAPVRFNGHFGDVSLTIDGTVGPLAPTYTLDVTTSLKTDSLASIPALSSLDLPDIGPLSISANLVAHDGKYSLNTLHASLEDKKIKGNVKAAVADLAALNGIQLEANISTDQLTEILQSFDFQPEFSLPDSLEAAVTAEGNLKDLTVNKFQASLQGQGLNVDVTGQVKNIMTLEGILADVVLDLESPDYIAEIIQTELPPLGPLTATVNITSTGQQLDQMQINVNLNSDLIHAGLAASIGDPVNLKEINGDINISADSLEWLADYLKLELPQLGSFKASAAFASKNNTYELKNIKANLDGDNITAVLTGEIGDLLKVQEIEADVNLGVQTLDFMKNYAEIQLPLLGPLQVSAHVGSKDETFEASDIKIDLKGEGFHAKAAGSVGDLIKLQSIDTSIDFNLESLALLSDVAQTDLPPLGPLNGSAVIASRGDSFELKELKLNLQDKTIQAKVAASVTDVLKLTGIKAEINASVDSLASLDDLAKQELPSSGPVTLKGSISSAGLDAPARIDAVLQSSSVVASVKGSIANPLAAEALDLSVNLEAESMQDIGELTGAELPNTKPVQLQGRIITGLNSYELTGLNLKIDDLDIKGKAAFQQPAKPGGRPQVSAALHIGELNIRKLQRARLEAAEAAEATPESEKKEAEADDQVPKKKIFPAHPLPWDLLRKVDADIEVTMEMLKTLQLNLENMVVGLKLDNGLLRLTPLQAAVGNGTFGGSATLDARNSPALLAADIELSDATFRDFGGTVNFQIDLEGSGNSVAEIMAGIDGQLEFDVRDVTLKRSLMTGFGTGLLSSLNPFTEHDENTELICAIILFDIEDGIAEADKTIAAQMVDVTWFGSGEINLQTEEIDFGMSPKSRRGLIGLGNLASLAHLGGTLAEPKIVMNPKDVAVKYGKYTAAVASGGLTLLADIVFSRVKANKDVCASILDELSSVQGNDEQEINRTKKTLEKAERNVTKKKTNTGSIPDATDGYL